MKQAELAEIFNISVSGLKKWGVEGFPVKRSLAEMVQWVRKNRPLGDGTLADERKEFLRVQRKIKDLQLSREKGDLISLQDVISDLSILYSAIRISILSWKKRLPPILQGASEMEMSQILDSEIYYLLTELASGQKEIIPKNKKDKP
jgi:phage terminase Nu1 subunit (DNA packaging protein)